MDSSWGLKGCLLRNVSVSLMQCLTLWKRLLKQSPYLHDAESYTVHGGVSFSHRFGCRRGCSVVDSAITASTLPFSHNYGPGLSNVVFIPLDSFGYRCVHLAVMSTHLFRCRRQRLAVFGDQKSARSVSCRDEWPMLNAQSRFHLFYT